MVRLYFHNLPSITLKHRYFSFKPERIVNLRQQIATAVGCLPEDVKFLLVKSEHLLLLDNSDLIDTPVLIEVDGHFGKDIGARRAISDALFEFLKFYSLEGSLNITFSDGPIGTFFAEKNGEMLPVSPPVKNVGFNYWPYHDRSHKPKS